jgi:hypothetical protein
VNAGLGLAGREGMAGGSFGVCGGVFEELATEAGGDGWVGTDLVLTLILELVSCVLPLLYVSYIPFHLSHTFGLTCYHASHHILPPLQ